MNRYAIIHQKRKREIVLLQGRPCFWGKCTFCDYTEDNSINQEANIKVNRTVLAKVTGIYGCLEVINSGSVFELPKQTLEDIKEKCKEKEIHTLFFEAHWVYRNRLDEIRDFFAPMTVKFKTGVETFDNDFREKVLNKNAPFTDYKEVLHYFDSPCLLIGIEGQSKEMIARDIEICKENFEWATLNIFIENSTPLKRDEALITWFLETYGHLREDVRFELLEENTDFGVG